MKKLLSLLSILTISGSAIPTTIAASPYKNQEKLNNEVNYLQTNNVENLNRVKRNLNFEEITASKINNPNWHISTLAIDNNKNLYFGTDAGAFILKYGETIPIKITMNMNSYDAYYGKKSTYINAIINNDNKTYFATNDNSLWVLTSWNNLNYFNGKINLREIDNISDNAILNELN